MVRRSALLCLMLAMAAALAGCSGQSTEGTSPSAAAATAVDRVPKIVVEPAVYDFGVIGINAPHEHTFTIRNEGNAVLTLEPGKPGCKCTSFTVDKLELQPGESTHARVAWSVDKPTEQFEQYAPIHTNDPTMPEAKLTIRGSVQLALVVLPNSVDVGLLPDGKPAEYFAKLGSPVKNNFKITAIKPSSPLIEVIPEPMSNPTEMDLRNRSGYRLRFRIHPGAAVGRFRETVDIETDIPGEEGKTSITLTGARPGPIRIIGRYWDMNLMALRLPDFRARDGIVARLNLVYTGGEELQFTSVECELKELSVTLTPRNGDGPAHRNYELEIKIAGGAPALARQQDPIKVTVDTNRPDVGKLTFRILANSL